MKKTSTIGIILVLLLACMGAVSAANLISNGGFEESPVFIGDFLTLNAGSTVLAPWVIDSGSIDLINTYWPPASGSNSIDLAGYGPGNISQVLATTPGGKYDLSFMMAGNPTCPPTIKTVQVFWDGVTQGIFTFDTTGNNLGSMGWVSKGKTGLVASGGSTVLKFVDVSDSYCGVALDDIRVDPGNQPVETNQPPVFDTIENKIVTVGQILTFTVSANDPDSDDVLTYSYSPSLFGATLNPSTGEFSWTPSAGDVGDNSITFTVTDNGNPQLSDSEMITINVIQASQTPDLWISEVKPVQVVWDSDINQDGKIDLVAQKPTAIVAKIKINNADALDQNTPIPIRFLYDGQIMNTISKTVGEIQNSGLVNFTFIPTTEGEHEVLVIVDPLNEIQESDETNNSNSQKVSIKEVNDLYIWYFPITSPKWPYSTKISPIDIIHYQTTVEKNNEFLQATFPLSVFDFYPSVNTGEKISANWPIIENDATLELSMLGDLLEMKNRRLKDWQPNRINRFAGIVPEDYFSAHHSDSLAIASYVIPHTVLSTVGHYAAISHEISHTFYLHSNSEEYFDVKNWPPYNGGPVGGKAASGYDVMDLYDRGFSNRYLWHGELDVDENPFTTGGLCFMGDHHGINTYYLGNSNDPNENLPHWICKEDYIDLFKALRTNPSDPELLYIIGIFYENGTFSIDGTYWINEGIPDDLKQGDYSVVLFDKNQQIISTTPFSDPYELIAEPHGIVKMKNGIIAFTIPFPKETATIQIKHEETVLTTFNPHEQLLADAIDNIPTTGFVKNPDQMRKALQNKVAALDKMIADKKYGEARDKLRNDIKKSVQNWLKDGYSTTNPLEITKEDLLALIDNTIGRLETLSKK